MTSHNSRLLLVIGLLLGALFLGGIVSAFIYSHKVSADVNRKAVARAEQQQAEFKEGCRRGNLIRGRLILLSVRKNAGPTAEDFVIAPILDCQATVRALGSEVALPLSLQRKYVDILAAGRRPDISHAPDGHAIVW